MEKIIDGQIKKELSFDSYGRYAIIRGIINKNRKEGQKFKVLDVGGRGNILKKFLPKDEVFYLDPFVDSEDDNFIKGDGCAMPLEDGSFDWVASADVFEHIPKEKRETFLKENVRVAKFGVILAAPFWSKEVEQAEINANENYKNFSSGKNHMWLIEHIKNGLPKEEEIEEFITNKKLSFQKLYNNRLFLWENLLGISFFVGNNYNEDIQRAFENFNYFYNTEVFPYDCEEPAYRKIYFIKKNVDLKDVVANSRYVDDILFLNVIKRAIDLVAKIDIINKNLIQKKDQELHKKEQEIKFMKASKFWKLREVYLKIKNYGRKK